MDPFSLQNKPTKTLVFTSTISR